MLVLPAPGSSHFMRPYPPGGCEIPKREAEHEQQSRSEARYAQRRYARA
jgi:hypothetical protein